MGYMKVIESSTTWECPKTGSYKIICVAGGEGGAASQGVKAYGGSTSFGGHLTASGCWGGHDTNDSTNNTIIKIPRNGYTFLNYGGLDYAEPDSEALKMYQSIGYGGGGNGIYPGGCGKLKMTIVTLNEGDTVNCTVGEGGSGDYSAGKPGVIVIQYQGDDGWASTSIEAAKKVTINCYAYGELVNTISVNAGEEVTLAKLDKIKSDDVEHYGWTKTAGSTTRNYSPETTIYPTSDMELYAIFKFGRQDVESYAGGSGTVGRSGSLRISGMKINLTFNGDTYVSSSYGGYSLRTNGDSPYVTVNGSYVGGYLGNSSGPTTITKSVLKGDVVDYNSNKSSSEGRDVSYDLRIERPVWAMGYYYRSDIEE